MAEKVAVIDQRLLAPFFNVNDIDNNNAALRWWSVGDPDDSNKSCYKVHC
jgi:hypothetical protein